jgi:hypothetical protein
MATWNLRGVLRSLRRLYNSRRSTDAPPPDLRESPSRTDRMIDQWYPLASSGGCWIRSCVDNTYNCIAWAAGECNIHWWPIVASGCYWPPTAKLECTVEAFISAFASVGYTEWSNENGRLEKGFEKIAIYVDNTGEVTHAARQLPNGRWASKLGRWKDVEHATVELVEGACYGKVVKYLRRRRRPLPAMPPSQCQVGEHKICKATSGPCPSETEEGTIPPTDNSITI